MLKRRLSFSARCGGDPALVKDAAQKVIVIRALQNKLVYVPVLAAASGGNFHAERRVLALSPTRTNYTALGAASSAATSGVRERRLPMAPGGA